MRACLKTINFAKNFRGKRKGANILERALIQFLLFSIILNPLQAKSEKEIINDLLHYLEVSDVIFFKNSIPYSSKEGRSLLESNFTFSGNTIKTAEEFIDRIASKSAQTGQVYYVKLENGEKFTLKEWFSEKLENIRKKHSFKKRNKRYFLKTTGS